MIYRLTGVVTEIFPDAFVLKAGSMEWYLEASATTLSRLPRDGSEVQILTYLHHREDVMQLFGFIDQAEKQTFHGLTSVQGIGPKAAIRILSGISPTEFITALETENVQRLESVPGLGKKTAQKILLALAGKLVIQGESQSAAPRDKNQALFLDMEEALVAMGFERKLIREVLPEQSIHAAKKCGILPQDGEPSYQDVFGVYSELKKAEREQFEGMLLRNCIVQLS